MPLPIAVLASLVVVASLPILLPFVVVEHLWRERTLRRAAEIGTCVRCGAVLGRAALERADAAFAAERREFCLRHPNVRFRIVRTLRAVCGTCGARYDFEAARGGFVPLPGPAT